MTRAVLLSLVLLAILPAYASAAAAPRLAGIYAATVRSNTLDGHPDAYFEPGGDPAKWRITPVCRRGACNVRWADLGYRTSRGRISEVPAGSGTLIRSGNTYTGRIKSACPNENDPTEPVTLTITITASVVRKGQRVATRFTARMLKKVITSGGDEETPPTYSDRVHGYSGRAGRANGQYGMSEVQCISRSV